MKKRIKRIVLYSFSIILLLFVVLLAHIYYYYRPAPDATTKFMARVDIKQQINQGQANDIAAWMYHQKGVDHALVNPQSNIVVFTFFPVKASANKIVSELKSNFHLKAERFIPTGAELKSSCPVAASSYTYKIFQFISKII